MLRQGVRLSRALHSNPSSCLNHKIESLASYIEVFGQSKQAIRCTSNMSNPVPSSSLPAETQEWLVMIPDHANVLSKRMEVRPKHFENLPSKIESGFMKAGGATMAEPLKEGESMKLNGSFMIAKAESEEEILKKLRDDIYTTSGVWDLEKVTITPVSECHCVWV